MRVTVLIPVYNAEKYLKEAIESILNQTYTDFELLIINDGSNDKSSIIIDSIEDDRIKHIKIEKNKGIVNALNIGLDLARGEFIVRMDSDDIAKENRIERLVEFMDANSEIGVAGSWVEYFGERSGIIKLPQNHNEIVWGMLKGSVLFHPAVILRKSVLIESRIKYPEGYPHAEDYALWMLLLPITRFANVPEVLLKYRFSGTSVGSRFGVIQKQSASKVSRRLHELLLGESISDFNWSLISSYSLNNFNIPIFAKIYSKINQENKLFGDVEFKMKLFARIKQYTLLKGLDFPSKKWMFNKSFQNPKFLWYLLNSTFKG